ncbi:MAG: hypothetical protein ACOWWM_17510, partial [Desulfobacterales bacterium]
MSAHRGRLSAPCGVLASRPILDVALLRLRSSGRCGLARNRNPPPVGGHWLWLWGAFFRQCGVLASRPILDVALLRLR